MLVFIKCVLSTNLRTHKPRRLLEREEVGNGVKSNFIDTVVLLWVACVASILVRIRVFRIIFATQKLGQEQKNKEKEKEKGRGKQGMLTSKPMCLPTNWASNGFGVVMLIDKFIKFS